MDTIRIWAATQRLQREPLPQQTKDAITSSLLTGHVTWIIHGSFPLWVFLVAVTVMHCRATSRTIQEIPGSIITATAVTAIPALIWQAAPLDVVTAAICAQFLAVIIHLALRSALGHLEMICQFILIQDAYRR